MKTFDLGDVNGSMDLPFLKAPEDWRQDEKDDAEDEAGNVSGIFLDDNNAGGFDDDDDNIGGFDMAPDVGFGEGGEAWAQELALALTLAYTTTAWPRAMTRLLKALMGRYLPTNSSMRCQ